MLINNTPLERHILAGREILVKREDLCCPYPGPSFSKIRGVVAHIQNRPEKAIGVLDTFHSKAGWAVAYVCAELGRECFDFWPRYKADAPAPAVPRRQQNEAWALGAQLIDLPAGRSAILYHRARAELARRSPGAYLMPNALKLPESVTENAAEAMRTAADLPLAGTLVISISSGTVAAGVLSGFAQAGLLDLYRVILHMGYSRSVDAVTTYIRKAATVPLNFGGGLELVDEGYGYADAVKTDRPAPFPCNPYYDAKAWRWLETTLSNDPGAIPGPIVFWNIGD